MIEFNLKQFKELSEFHKPHCVSILTPTHRSGEDVNKGVDKTIFKNQLKQAEKELGQYQLSGNEIDSLLEPARELLDDFYFWKHQSDGLAVFIGPDYFKYFTLPVHFEEHVYVSDHFYLRTMVPLFNSGGKFYILSLSQQEVKLFEGFPYQINELEVEDLLPGRLEEAVGFDYQQKSLQFRQGQTGSGQSMFHGQGSGKDDRKEEILKFFRAVDKGVMKAIEGSKVPLIIACVDYLFPIYKEASEYRHLHEDFIKGNPEGTDQLLLHEKAMQLLEEQFGRAKREKIASFEQALSHVKASYDVGEIIPASINGRVDTLFIQNGTTLWGIFEKSTNTIMTEEEKTPQNVDLLNIAAIRTILQDGTVYLLDKDEMPAPAGVANAILRF